jgi:hypothetical protein
MINANNKSLSSILRSKSGVHLSAYLKNDGNLENLRKKLGSYLEKAEEQLDPVLSHAEKTEFLRPLRELMFDAHTLREMRGNLALFRKENYFQCKALNTEIEEVCVLADTFHIKPIIKWAQVDQEFVLLTLGWEGFSGYQGSLNSFRKTHSMGLPKSLKKSKRPRLKQQFAKVLEFIGDQERILFLAGNPELAAAFVKETQVENFYPQTLEPVNFPDGIDDICQKIRSVLTQDAEQRLKQTIQDFDVGGRMQTAKTSFFSIAREAVRGNVQKLIIAEDFHLFGKLDPLTGQVDIHPGDLDYKDDCLLDDVAQAVLLSGGEVVVAKQSEIPKEKPIMAFLNKPPIDLRADNLNFRKYIGVHL